MTASHFTPGLTLRYWFRGRGGTVYTRQIVANRHLAGTDICVNLLDEALPEGDVTPARVLREPDPGGFQL